MLSAVEAHLVVDCREEKSAPPTYDSIRTLSRGHGQVFLMGRQGDALITGSVSNVAAATLSGRTGRAACSSVFLAYGTET